MHLLAKTNCDFDNQITVQSTPYSDNLSKIIDEQCNNDHENINPSLAVTNFSETEQNMPKVEYNKENSPTKLNETLEVKSDMLGVHKRSREHILTSENPEHTLENTASQVDNDINLPVPKSDVTGLTPRFKVTRFNSIKHNVRRRR
ncbi:20213_t:CDS:2, partial [Dentiscutata erythropus]